MRAAPTSTCAPACLPTYMYITGVKPGALAVPSSYRVQSCLIDRDQPSATLPAASGEWQQAFQDKPRVLFLRKHSDLPDGEQ